MQDTVRRRRSMDGQKLTVKTWTNQLKKITLTKWRKSSSIDTNQIGVYNWMMLETMHRWHLALTIKEQSHWQIPWTDDQKIIRSHCHHSMKFEDEQDPKSPKHIVKDLELVRKSGGHFGWDHILQASGRVRIGLEGVLIKSWNSDLILIQFSCCSVDFFYSRSNPL